MEHNISWLLVLILMIRLALKSMHLLIFSRTLNTFYKPIWLLNIRSFFGQYWKIQGEHRLPIGILLLCSLFPRRGRAGKVGIIAIDLHMKISNSITQRGILNSTKKKKTRQK